MKALAEGQKEINEVALAEIEKFIPQDASALRTNSDYLQQHQDAGHILAAARSLHLILSNQLGEGQSELSSDDKRQVEETLMQIVSPEVQPDLAVYKQALAFYVSPLKSSDEARSAFLSAVRKNLPLGFDFKELSEIASRREAWSKEDDSVATNGDSKK